MANDCTVCVRNCTQEYMYFKKNTANHNSNAIMSRVINNGFTIVQVAVFLHNTGNVLSYKCWGNKPFHYYTQSFKGKVCVKPSGPSRQSLTRFL